MQPDQQEFEENQINMKDAVISVLVNWKNFDGRACRSEFWYFGLASGLLGFVIGFVEVAAGIVDIENAGAGILSLMFSLAILVPSILVTSRWLHDRGLSDWWQLFYVTLIGTFVFLVLCALPSKHD